jgi:hypothetical protein
MIGMETRIKAMRTQKIVMICKRRTNLIILFFAFIAISFFSICPPLLNARAAPARSWMTRNERRSELGSCSQIKKANLLVDYDAK